MLCPYLVSTDVLGDSPGLTGDNIRTSNRVQQLRLTVVNVTHDRHNRRPNDEIFVVFFLIQVDVKALQELFVFVLGGDNLNLVAKLRAQHLEGCCIE